MEEGILLGHELTLVEINSKLGYNVYHLPFSVQGTGYILVLDDKTANIYIFEVLKKSVDFKLLYRPIWRMKIETFLKRILGGEYTKDESNKS